MSVSLQQDYDYLFKLLLIGNSSVGKSSILLRFADNTFTDNFLPTIGVDFKIKTFELQQKIIKMQIWDTAGQERFKTITSSYYRGAHAVLIVYDITDRQSFVDVENWLIETEKHASDGIIRLLVGNKSDLESKRIVTSEEGRNFAVNNGLEFIETSSKNNVNIEDAFLTVAKKIKEKVQKLEEKSQGKGGSTKKTTVKIDTNEKQNGRCC